MLLEITFIVMALLILGSALMVLRTTELIHATVWLAAMLFGVAGIFLTLNAEFLAVVQILVYVGAVITLILFTVMLTMPTEKDFLSDLELPPGVSVESIEDLQRSTPEYLGAGPYKDLKDTNPRRPLRNPTTLYGIALVDNEYGTDTTDRSKEGSN